MPLYSIRRNVGTVDREEIDAAAMRSLWCMQGYPGIEWIHSTWDKDGGTITCLYRAPNPQQIRSHAEASRIPCDEIREVELIDPNEYLHG